MSDNLEHIVSVAAGGFAGVCSTVITNPLDVMRTRLAASREASGAMHKSLSCHARDLCHQGVVSGLMTGLGANIMASMPSNAIYLSTYRRVNQYLKSHDVNCNAVPIFSALAAVLATNLTLSPLFLLRTRVQVDPSRSLGEVTRTIYKTDGFKGFYRGTLTNVAGRFVEEAIFWSTFEFLKRTTDEGTIKAHNHFLWNAIAVVSLSSVSKLVGTMVAYPYNVVMTHLRTPNKVTQVYEHTHVIPTVKHIYRADGLAGFYKGLAPQIMRSLVSKATQIYAFELAMAAYITTTHNRRHGH